MNFRFAHYKNAKSWTLNAIGVLAVNNRMAVSYWQTYQISQLLLQVPSEESVGFFFLPRPHFFGYSYSWDRSWSASAYK